METRGGPCPWLELPLIIITTDLGRAVVGPGKYMNAIHLNRICAGVEEEGGVRDPRQLAEDPVQSVGDLPRLPALADSTLSLIIE